MNSLRHEKDNLLVYKHYFQLDRKMKTIAIIYIVSWLLLLVVYIISQFQGKKSKKKDNAYEKFLNEHKSKKERIIDKLVYVVMVVLAPLVVFVVPYILIRDMKLKKQERAERECREKKEKEQEEHKTDCSTKYSSLVGAKQNQCSGDFVRIAKSLKKLVKEKSYHEIIKLLDKASLPSEMKLEVQECEHQGSGAASRLFIDNPENARDYNIFEYLKFEDSPMGAWQAYLLCQIRHYLPLWWHANYNRRDYIYTREDFADITHFIDRGFNVDVLNGYNVNPEIYGKEGKYYITCCFWTEFGGLRREFVEISLEDNRFESLFVFDDKVLYEYQCGIMF